MKKYILILVLGLGAVSAGAYYVYTKESDSLNSSDTYQKTTEMRGEEIITDEEAKTIDSPSVGKICGVVTYLHGAQGFESRPYVVEIEIKDRNHMVTATTRSNSEGYYEVSAPFGFYTVREKNYGTTSLVEVSKIDCNTVNITIAAPSSN